MDRMHKRVLLLVLVVAGVMFVFGEAVTAKDWVTYRGGEGSGKGKHIVFVTGDEEYRSEESMPQLAKILSVHHGFKCTVLFGINDETKEIDPADDSLRKMNLASLVNAYRSKLHLALEAFDRRDESDSPAARRVRDVWTHLAHIVSLYAGDI